MWQVPIAPSQELARRQHEAPALPCDLTNGGLPYVPVVCRRSAVELHALGVHRRPHEWHVVFPTDHGADPTERRVDDRHGGSVAEPPDQALHRGRHHLAVLAQQFALGTEEERGAVEGPARLFDHADHEVEAGLGGHLTEPLGRRTGHIYRTRPVAPKLLTSFGRSGAHDRPEIQPLRIASDERFGEHGESRTIRSGASRELGDLLQSGLHLEEDGSVLDHLDTHRADSRVPHSKEYPMREGSPGGSDGAAMPGDQGRCNRRPRASARAGFFAPRYNLRSPLAGWVREAT
jgi:hypothetical protein